MLANEGLGNQLFIFAAGLVAQKKTGLPLYVVPALNNIHSKKDYRDLFKVPTKVQIMEDANAKPRMNAANTLIELVDHHATAKWSNANIKYNSASPKNVKMPGRLFQNYSAVKSVIPVVKDTLKTNEFSKSQYREIEKNTPSASAFIHIRRGDYNTKGWALDQDYYLRGIDELEKDPNIQTIWIISSDLEWCKTVPWTTHTKKPIEYYDSRNELEVLYKMMLCDAGAVLSASTFSAWGAMLGADLNPRQVTIVYPISWLTHDADGDNPLEFPEKWVAIPNSVA